MRDSESHLHHGDEFTQADRLLHGGTTRTREAEDDDIDNTIGMYGGIVQDDYHIEDELEPWKDPITRYQAWCLYASHALSMWNSRTYEFAAVRILPERSDEVI